MKDAIAIGALCTGLLAISLVGAVADLRMFAKGERQAAAAALILQQQVCSPPIVASYDAPGCSADPDQDQLYYWARFEALNQY